MRPSSMILDKVFSSVMMGEVVTIDAPSKGDLSKVQKILDNPSLPAKAEDGKAYVIRWADGRAVFAVRTKKALADWLKKTGSCAEIVSIKYGEPEVSGKKIRVSESEHIPGLILEATFQAQDMDLDKTYSTFKSSYEKQTGQAWEKDKFLKRIQGWTLYGEQDGFVAVREQRGGILKLVGAAGNPAGVKKGFKEVLATGKPVWGAMDIRLASIAARMGMKMPPAWIMTRVLGLLKDQLAKSSGLPPGAVTINKDGSMTIQYPDVGAATKFMVGNRQYFDFLLKSYGDKIPAMLRTAISFFLTTGKPPPEPEDEDESPI